MKKNMDKSPFLALRKDKKGVLNRFLGKEGLSRDKFGNKVANKSSEAHIPLDEFEYFQE